MGDIFTDGDKDYFREQGHKYKAEQAWQEYMRTGDRIALNNTQTYVQRSGLRSFSEFLMTHGHARKDEAPGVEYEAKYQMERPKYSTKTIFSALEHGPDVLETGDARKELTTHHYLRRGKEGIVIVHNEKEIVEKRKTATPLDNKWIVKRDEHIAKLTVDQAIMLASNYTHLGMAKEDAWSTELLNLRTGRLFEVCMSNTYFPASKESIHQLEVEYKGYLEGFPAFRKGEKHLIDDLERIAEQEASSLQRCTWLPQLEPTRLTKEEFARTIYRQRSR